MRRTNPMRSLMVSLLLGTAAPVLTACDDENRWEEAAEEVEDEARDAKEEIRDEIDDRTS